MNYWPKIPTNTHDRTWDNISTVQIVITWKLFVTAKSFCMCEGTLVSSVRVSTADCCHANYIVSYMVHSKQSHQEPMTIAYSFLCSWVSAWAAEESNHIVCLLLFMTNIWDVFLPPQHLVFALACWNGRKARLLFITFIFGEAQWKNCLCLGGLGAARTHQYSQHGHKSNTTELWG